MHNRRLRSSRVLLKQRRSSPKLELSVGCRSRPCPEPTLAGLVLDYTLHCERAEPRIFFADLLLRITSTQRATESKWVFTGCRCVVTSLNAAQKSKRESCPWEKPKTFGSRNNDAGCRRLDLSEIKRGIFHPNDVKFAVSASTFKGCAGRHVVVICENSCCSIKSFTLFVARGTI